MQHFQVLAVIITALLSHTMPVLGDLCLERIRDANFDDIPNPPADTNQNMLVPHPELHPYKQLNYTNFADPRDAGINNTRLAYLSEISGDNAMPTISATGDMVYFNMTGFSVGCYHQAPGGAPYEPGPDKVGCDLTVTVTKTDGTVETSECAFRPIPFLRGPVQGAVCKTEFVDVDHLTFKTVPLPGSPPVLTLLDSFSYEVVRPC